MADQRWFYELLMEEFGPVDVTVIHQLVSDGTLEPTSRVRPESSGDWMTIADLPASSDSSESDDSGANDERHAALDIDSFSFESTEAEPDIDSFTFEATEADRHSDLDIDSFNLQSDSESPQPDAPSRHRPEPVDEPEGEEEETTYFVQSLGLELGPLLQSELLEMATSGSLSRGDEIREGVDGRWIPIEAIAGLGSAVMQNELPGQRDSVPTSAVEDVLKKSSSKKSAAADRKSSRKKKRPPTPKKRRRKPKKKDEFLQQIFAEVFTEEGKLRHEKETPTQPTAAATAAPSSDVSTADTGATASPQPTPGVAAEAAVPATPSVPEPQAYVPPPMSSPPTMPPAYSKPKPRPKPAKSSSSGGGFTMPEPKVLGMVGGGLAVVLILVGGFMGIIPLPGFGVDAESFLKEFAVAYSKSKDGSAEDWKALRDEYSPQAREVAKALSSQVASDPKAKRYQQAALKVVTLLRKPYDDVEDRKKTFEEFNKAMMGI